MCTLPGDGPLPLTFASREEVEGMKVTAYRGSGIRAGEIYDHMPDAARLV